MDVQTLHKHLFMLATLPENNDPVISCYANVGDLANAAVVHQFEERARLLRRAVRPYALAGFEQALQQINGRLAGPFKRESKGLAVFARGGGRPFFQDLDFRVPLPNRLTMDSSPNIYHLVELKDTYDRYVVVLMDQHSTRILEIHLGSITKAILAERADFRRTVGRTSSREHYQSRNRELGNRHVNEVARILDELVSKKGYAHLILAGNPQLIAMLRGALPKRSAAKIIDAIPTGTSDCTNDVISATLASFVDQEQEESLATVERLRNAICSHGLAVAGSSSTLKALQNRQVDTLVMAQEYVPEPAWRCSSCHAVSLDGRGTAFVGCCRSPIIRELDLKEEFARLAEINGCGVEIVHSSETLMRLGGVGCLLRYLTQDTYCRPAA